MSVSLDSGAEADAKEICVKWSGYGSNLLGALAAADDALADVTLVAGGRSFPAHRLVLSANSALFRALFQQTPSPVRPHEALVLLHEVEAECVHALLAFMYRGEVRVSEQLLPRLLQAAEALRVCGLSAAAVPPAADSPLPPPPPSVRQKSTSSLLAKKRKKYENEEESKPKKKSKEIAHQNSSIIPKKEPPESPSPPPPPPPPLSIDEEVESVLHSGAAVESLILASAPTPVTASASTTTLATAADCSATHDKSSSTYASPSFPCPFCPRVYNSWGYRRRHVKSRHHTDRLSCKWCVSVLESTGAWYGHATRAHGAPAAAARDSLVVLVEAHAVLTLHEPSPAALLRQLEPSDRDAAAHTPN